MARGRPGVSVDAIKQAIEQLVSNGEEPSLIKIRDISKASYGTISPVLEEWRTQRHKQVNVEVPTTVRERGSAILESALQAVWAEAAQTMQEQIAKIREQAQREIAAAHTAQHEAETALTELEDENTAQAQALYEAHTTSETLRTELEQARTAMGVAQARADELQTRAQHAEQQLAAVESGRHADVERINQLERELGRLEGELGPLRQLIERLTCGPKSE